MYVPGKGIYRPLPAKPPVPEKKWDVNRNCLTYFLKLVDTPVDYKSVATLDSQQIQGSYLG